MCMVIVMLSMATSNMNVMFPTYAEVVGLGAIVGGLMVTVASLADIALNPVIGATADKLGATKSMVIWAGITMVSFGILYFSAGSPVLAFIGAGVNDAMYALCGVGLATYAMALFGKKDYERIFSFVMMGGYLVAAFGVPFLMGIYEFTGSFQNVFLVCIGIDLLIIVCAIIGDKTSKKLPRTTGTVDEA